MKREILINATPKETRVAIIEDDQLVELLVDRPDARRMVGDIYLGRIEAVLPGLQAAFVDIGTEKSAFLHASDIIDPDAKERKSAEDEEEDDDDSVAESEPPAEDGGKDGQPAGDGREEKQGGGRGGRGRSGRGRQGGAREGREGHEGREGGRRKRPEAKPIQELVKRGQNILVQVSKEPISTKGPRVTADISLAGRFLVYMPYASRVGVSRKIGERSERSRLRKMVEEILPPDSGGVIIRTVSEDATKEAFNRELQTLMNTWKRAQKKTHFVRAPAKVHSETNLTRGLIRDLFSDKVEQVTVDSKQVFNEIQEYLKGVAPELADRVKLYEEQVPLFDKANIEPEIRDIFKRRCDLPSGGYLIIEPTEALVSIDVNSGRYTGKKDPEKTILRTNIEAAREVARQLRLRDVGGIVVADFIDMETRSNRDKVLQELRTHMGRDRARTKAYAVSDLGLIEMTRQRVRQSHLQAMTNACSTCHGTGRVFTAETIVRRVERAIKRMNVEGRKDHMLIKLHPDVAMYLLEQERTFMKNLEKLAEFKVELRDDPLLRPDEFKLVLKSAGRDVTQQYAVA